MDKETTYFKRLYNGDLGLAKTFWIWNILICFPIVFFSFLVFGLNFFLYGLFDSRVFSLEEIDFIIDISNVVIFYPIGFFLLFCLYRATNKYQGLKVWKILSYCYIFLGLISTIIDIITLFTYHFANFSDTRGM